MAKVFEGEKRVFTTGNEVAAWAAVAAGAEMMFGYPITPQNEIMHYWTRLAPKHDKRFLQTEDEISAGFTTCGAVQAGRKAFTATAGPGNVIMQEPFGMAEAMRLPIVAIIQQRGGPSSGTVIYSQQEVTLTAYGGNGEGYRIVYSTATHQEIYDYVIKAFNTAWKYRFPTFILGDGYQAKMREPLIMYNPEDRGIEMVPAEPMVGLPGTIGVDREAQHRCNIYSLEEELYEVVLKFDEEFNRIAPEIVEHEQSYCDDADVLVVSHGVVSRAALDAVEILRDKGIKAGYFRPITLRPFPGEALNQASQSAKQVLVVESAMGQLMKLAKQEMYQNPKPMVGLFRPALGIVADEIVNKVKTMI
ncbi:MAG: ferredoxin oxidoreductase [Firmicutes bacterium]|nr:ferredoxin oxidoreductase [Bacillota bacterium]